MLSAGKQIGIAVAVAAMAAVVVLSNVLVQHPVALTIGELNLADLLTWGPSLIRSLSW